ncbi:phage coat protein [Clostridioides sp. ZZV13-5731]|uniref:phage coat protein n=1 Tax=unclassified Clostridioides TaxID=2635829 RepID=UPI001D12628B|nr:phage coat protein [Clostridioides sp. ZZV14-6045]MCC0732604.1 phage coat protein [Clostridioides sp. ZZV14-6048]MCC0752614.1 phage coat protein [Clostridioides sp. ZZV13-5731]
MALFDSKNFNGEVFGQYVETVPNLKRNELIKSGAIKPRDDLKALFSEQTGAVYGTIPMFGLIDGDAVNYDGQTDIIANTTKTFSQSVHVVGRANSWVEKDFSKDVTGGVPFMENVGNQVAKYWDNIDQKTLLSVLEGIFSMTGAKNLEFVNNHTFDVTKEVDAENQKVKAETLNTALQKACGDNKEAFSLVIMHSVISTNLENLNLMARLKYTDPQGIERELKLGTWNGNIVLIDDSMPTKEVAESTEGAGDGYTEFTTYALGEGSIHFVDVGAETPYEMDREARKNGGQTYLISRQRKVFAPYGISFTKKSVATLSPTDAELRNGVNWELVNDNSNGSKTYIDHKAIPIARIVSRG